MATATKKRPTLADKHKEFKENAVRVLHEYANRADHCYSFDSFMVEIAGLPGRDSYHQPSAWSTGNERPEIYGERTTKAFEAWKTRVEEEAWRRADEYGLSNAFDGAMERAGFRRRPRYVNTDVTVRGTFEVTRRVRHREGVDPQFPLGDLGRDVRTAIIYGHDNVSWEVV